MNVTLQQRIEEAAVDYANNLALPKWDKHPIHAIDFERGAIFALQNQWISVDEDLPEYEEDVFVRFIEHFQNNTNEFEVGYCTRWRTSDKSVKTDSKEFSIIGNMEITHWMPIPELPKGGEE